VFGVAGHSRFGPVSTVLLAGGSSCTPSWPCSSPSLVVHFAVRSFGCKTRFGMFPVVIRHTVTSLGVVGVGRMGMVLSTVWVVRARADLRVSDGICDLIQGVNSVMCSA
jgi:hypothetical protein